MTHELPAIYCVSNYPNDSGKTPSPIMAERATEWTAAQAARKDPARAPSVVSRSRGKECTAALHHTDRSGVTTRTPPCNTIYIHKQGRRRPVPSQRGRREGLKSQKRTQCLHRSRSLIHMLLVCMHVRALTRGNRVRPTAFGHLPVSSLLARPACYQLECGQATHFT